jgi:hypothetical protein
MGRAADSEQPGANVRPGFVFAPNAVHHPFCLFWTAPRVEASWPALTVALLAPSSGLSATFSPDFGGEGTWSGCKPLPIKTFHTRFHARTVRACFRSEQRERTTFSEPSGAFGLRAVSLHHAFSVILDLIAGDHHSGIDGKSLTGDE